VLRRRLDGKSPDLDEPFGRSVIERVAGIVGREAVIVKRVVRLPADDAAITLVELQPNRARHMRLNVLHERVDRRSRRRKP
jgi:hypothetical protein